MKNLIYKATENSKNTSGESGNNPSGGTGQLTEAQIRQLVQTAVDMGCTHYQTHFVMDTEAELATYYPNYAANYNLRTLYQDIRLWSDIIHEKGLRHVHRGTWSGIKGNNNFPYVKYGTSSFVPLGNVSDPAGGSTYCAKMRRYLETVGSDHFQTGDILAPISESTEFLSNSNYYWFDTSGGVQQGFYNFFMKMKDVVDDWGANLTEPKTFGYMSIVNFSEWYNSPGHYIDATLPKDQGLIAVDYYGHSRSPLEGSAKNGSYANIEEYITDWNELLAEVASTNNGVEIPFFQTELGGIWGDSWPTLGLNPALKSPRVNTYEEAAHYQIKHWQGLRDELVDTGKMIGVSNWGHWSGQNSSIVFFSNGTYKLNYFGQIYGNFLKGNGMARIPVPATTTMDSWGNRSNYF